MRLRASSRLLVFLCIVALHTLAFSHSGKVIDERGNPVAGALVRTTNSEWQTLTTAQGTFSSTTNLKIGSAAPRNRSPFSFQNGRLVVVSDKKQVVRVMLFDLTGRMQSKIYEQMGAGVHAIESGNLTQSGMSVLRITIGNAHFSTKAVLFGKNSSHSTEGNAYNKAQSAITSSLPSPDTLLISKVGHLNKRIVLRAADESLGNIRLYDTAFSVTAQNFPKIDGSTTNVPLARIICCKLLGTSYRWQETLVQVEFPANYHWAVLPDSSNMFLYNQIMSISRFSKTPQSYDSLIAGNRDLILVASAPSQRHYEAARLAGIEFDIRPLALDALLMVVNRNSIVVGITTQTIKDIYTRTVTNWQQIGGPDQEIFAYQREETSGSQELIKTLVMKGTPIDPTIPLLQGMLSVFDALHYGSNRISYTPYYYKEFQMRDTVIRSLQIDGVAPNREAIQSRIYPHCAEVLVVTRSNLSDTTKAAKLRDWLLAPQGQAIVDESGYVPIRPPSLPIAILSPLPGALW